MKNLGYVEAKINEVDIGLFHQLVTQICQQDDFYKSDVVNYINGEVTDELHLTIFYGCNAVGIRLKKLKEYISNIRLSSLRLGRLFLLPGYQGLYQALCIEVIDQDGKLRKISEDISSFGYDSTVMIREFTPHLTLAYVRKDYKIPNTKFVAKLVKIKSVDYSL